MPVRKPRPNGAVLVLGLSLLASALPVATAQEYEYTKLFGDEGINFFDPFLMAINAEGHVTIRVGLPPSEEAILRADGSTLTTIADTSGVFQSFGGEVLDIDDAGTVAFNASKLVDQTAFSGVFAGDGGPIITLGPVPPDPFQDPSYHLFSLRNDGLAIMGRGPTGQGPDRVVSSYGGPITTIYDQNDLPVADLASGVFFSGYMSEGGSLTMVVGPGLGLPWFVYRGSVAGVPFVRIASPTLTDPSMPVFGFATINGSNTVALREGSYGGFQGLYFGTAEASLTALATTDDPYFFFGYGGVAINDSGLMMFQAGLDAGGDGIFTGADPVADKVIATADALDGSTVASVQTNRFCLNESGQIAFYAMLADGRQGVYRATPVTLIFADGFESGDVSAWSNSVP